MKQLLFVKVAAVGRRNPSAELVKKAGAGKKTLGNFRHGCLKLFPCSPGQLQTALQFVPSSLRILRSFNPTIQGRVWREDGGSPAWKVHGLRPAARDWRPETVRRMATVNALVW